jgi:hypothetical protein
MVRVSPTGHDIYDVYSNGNIFCLLLAGMLGVSQFVLFRRVMCLKKQEIMKALINNIS